MYVLLSSALKTEGGAALCWPLVQARVEDVMPVVIKVDLSGEIMLGVVELAAVGADEDFARHAPLGLS